MKVVLAIAPWCHAETYPPSQGRSTKLSGPFGQIGGATPPLSLLYLSSALKKAGHQTAMADGFFLRNEQEFIDFIATEAPQLVGFWCSQFSWGRTKRMATKLKQRIPGLRIIVGGQFTTATGGKHLQEPDSQGLDFGLVSGDGEAAIVELVEALNGKRDFAAVGGLVWRKDGQVIFNGKRAFLESLDHIPFPDYDILDIGKYSPAIGSFKCLPSVNMMSVRGCAAKCAFCHSAKSLRSRRMDNVIEEIQWLQRRFGVRHLLFFDENFTYERERVVEFCSKLKEHNIRIRWTCNSRVDTIDLDLVRLMKSAGCWRLQFGAESGVQKQLDTIQKEASPEDNRRGILTAKRGGVDVFASFMFGIPGETYEEGLETIRFACSLPIDYANFLAFSVLAGSAFWENVEQYGRLIGLPAFHKISFVPHSMTHEQLADLLVRAPKTYYMRPRYLVRRFLQQRSWTDIRRNLRGFSAFSRMDARKDYLEVQDAPLEVDPPVLPYRDPPAAAQHV